MEDEIVLKSGVRYSYYVSGMHCPACEFVVEKELEKSIYIKNVNAILKENKIHFEVKDNINRYEVLQEVNSIIGPQGYTISEIKERHKVKFTDLIIGFVIAAGIFGIFFLIQKSGITNVIGGRAFSMTLVFLIGIIASLSSCMAVVGGIVLSISSNYARSKDRIRPLVFFHASRVIGFFLLGGILGLIGITFNLSPGFYFIMSIILFVVMLILGIHLLDIFPFFRRLQLKMPKSFSRKIIDNKSIQNRFTPLLLGILTFFLPCGFTQSMQINAIASGNFLTGGLTMLVFALGTLPVLALISFSSVRFANSIKSGIFFKTAGFIVIFFAFFNLLSALAAAGIIYPIF